MFIDLRALAVEPCADRTFLPTAEAKQALATTASAGYWATLIMRAQPIFRPFLFQNRFPFSGPAYGCRYHP